MSLARKTRPSLSPLAAAAGLALGILAAAGPPAHAGGALTAPDLTGFEPSPFPGEVLGTEARFFWEDGCIPLDYRLDTTHDPLPNPFGEDFLTLEEVRAAVVRAMETWNEIPTSYVEFELTGDDDVPGFAFDMVNEVAFVEFPGATFFAFSRSIAGFSDFAVVDGQDLDGDGDPDVVAGLQGCRDVDGDGDLEVGAGPRKAGQIFENDVVFNLTGLRYTAAEGAEAGSVDVEAVAAHELGHSHGLAHSLINQVSPEDGTSATMYPAVRIFDPVDQRAFRSLAQDDVGFSSLFYPEGSAASGPGALQPGDVAFDAVYGVIEGEVTHGVFGVGVPGASVSAVDTSTGEIAAAVYSGTVVQSFDLATSADRVLPGFDSVLDGRYRLPVPEGQYRVEIQPIDGFPVSTGSISPTARVGSRLGLLDFPEETFHQGEPEAAFELFPGRETPVNVSAGSTRGGVDLVTNRAATLATAPLAPPFALATAPPGAYLAQEIPAEQLAAADTGENLVIQGARFFTLPRFPSNVPVAAEAFFTTGRVLDENFADIDLGDPLAHTTLFVGQDLDLAPWFFQSSVAVGERAREVLAAGDDRTFFLVLRTPDDGSVPDFNLFVLGTFNFIGRTGSYFSGTGQVWGSSPLPLPLLFDLQVAEPVP